MREVDYLWDKQGGDLEVEQLEAALQGFAYAETAPPRIAVTLASAGKWSLFDIFRFRFAVAGACVVAICVSLGWNAFNRDNDTADIAFIDRSDHRQIAIGGSPDCGVPCTSPRVSKGDTLNNEQHAAVTNQNDLAVNDQQSATVIEAAHAIGPKKKKRKNVRMIYRPLRPLPEVTTAAVAVTREEADAYNKLMLALSITSSKLQIVKDRLDNGQNRER